MLALTAATSERLQNALVRAAKDINAHAHGLPDSSPQKPANERLAETVDALAELVEGVEQRPPTAFAIFCLMAHDLLASGVEQGLGAKFQAEFSSNNEAPAVNERDDTFYMNDSRLDEILVAIGPMDEWHTVVLRGLNKICTGRKKTDPVRGMVEIVITLVKLVAPPELVWSNKVNTEFIKTTTDRVRQIMTAPPRPTTPMSGNGADELRGNQPSKDFDTLQASEAQLRLQVSSLQQEMADRLAEAEAEKTAALLAIRAELQPQLDTAIDARDRAREKLADAEAELKLLRPLEDKYDQLYREHETCTANAGALTDPHGNPDRLAELTAQIASLSERLAVSEAALEVSQSQFRGRVGELDEAHQTIDTLTEQLQRLGGDTACALPSTPSTFVPITRPSHLDTDLLTAFARVNETVAALGSLVVERAKRNPL